MRSHSSSLSFRLAKQWRQKKGQTLVEYSLIIAVLAVVMIGAVSLLGQRIEVIFSAITTLLDTAQGSGSH